LVLFFKKELLTFVPAQPVAVTWLCLMSGNSVHHSKPAWPEIREGA
jgi:hypothetical protein